MSEERREINHIVMPTRENYRKHKEQLREGRRKIEEIEKREQEFFKLFTALFYGTIDEEGNVDKISLKKVSDTFSNYTAAELEEMYLKLQYLAPWKNDSRQHISNPDKGVLQFLMVYLTADFLLMAFLSFFVWRMSGSFIYIAYSATLSAGLMGIMLVVKGVIKHVRKKKEE
jgi:hypothetical protein